MYDVEFMFHELDIWFRINDIEAKDEEEAYELAKIKLKGKTGVDPEELARKNDTIYYMEILC